MKCKICHDAAEGKNKVGPTLKGLFGRTADMAAGYSFSDAMKNSGITWEKEKLEAYLADPKTLVHGTKMAFAGLKKPEDIENLIAYLEQVTK